MNPMFKHLLETDMGMTVYGTRVSVAHIENDDTGCIVLAKLKFLLSVFWLLSLIRAILFPPIMVE